MSKNKPRWKDLPLKERLIKNARRLGMSESTLEFLKERANRKRMERNDING